MKSVLTSIQPYYVFLIIARAMGWEIPQEKTVEVRKDFPTDPAWNKKVHIYCSKNRKSFNRIPEQYRPYMEKLLGKVIGEFVCDWGARLETIESYEGKVLESSIGKDLSETALTKEELIAYAGRDFANKCDHWVQFKYGCCGWHISDLKIYDKQKELGEFKKAGYMTEEQWLYALYPNTHCHYDAWAKKFEIARPPQSWCYVEGSA